MDAPHVVSQRHRTSRTRPTRARLLRLTAGLTQSELGQLAGVSREAVWAAESGRHDPHVSTLRALAAALGCRVDDLLNDDRPAAGRAIEKLGDDPADVLNGS